MVFIPIRLNQSQVKTVLLKWVITGQSPTSGTILFLSTAVEHFIHEGSRGYSVLRDRRDWTSFTQSLKTE